MVYEVKCSNCGDILDFGGKDPEDSFSGESKIPENGIKFDGEVYCRDCVQDLVEFGGKKLFDRLDKMENKIDEELG